MIPRNWLLEVGLQHYFMNGYGTAEEAAKAWGKKYGREDLLKVSEILPGIEIYVSFSVRAEPK